MFPVPAPGARTTRPSECGSAGHDSARRFDRKRQISAHTHRSWEPLGMSPVSPPSSSTDHGSLSSGTPRTPGAPQRSPETGCPAAPWRPGAIPSRRLPVAEPLGPGSRRQAQCEDRAPSRAHDTQQAGRPAVLSFLGGNAVTAGLGWSCHPDWWTGLGRPRHPPTPGGRCWGVGSSGQTRTRRRVSHRLQRDLLAIAGASAPSSDPCAWRVGHRQDTSTLVTSKWSRVSRGQALGEFPDSH